MFQELKDNRTFPNNSDETGTISSGPSTSKKEKLRISGDIRELFRAMINEDIQDEDVLFYVFSETFESKENQKVTDKLVKKLVEQSMVRQNTDPLRFEELASSLQQWNLKVLVENKLKNKFNRVKHERSEAYKKSLPSTTSTETRTLRRRRERLRY